MIFFYHKVMAGRGNVDATQLDRLVIDRVAGRQLSRLIDDLRDDALTEIRQVCGYEYRRRQVGRQAGGQFLDCLHAPRGGPDHNYIMLCQNTLLMAGRLLAASPRPQEAHKERLKRIGPKPPEE